MDADTIKGLVELLQSGGPVVMLLAVWVAFKAGQQAKEAVSALKEMRDAVVSTAPKVDQIAQTVAKIEDTLEDHGDKLDALLSRAHV